MNIGRRSLNDAASELQDNNDDQRNVADTGRSTTSCLEGTDPATAAQYFVTKSSPLLHGWSPDHGPCFQPKMKGNVDAEVGIAHHVRVACRRHQCSRRYPGPPVLRLNPILTLTHPQPCWAWSMIMTWQQVEIMRGESPKSYLWVVRG